MAHAPSLTRAERAIGIVERQELMLQDDGSWRVRDTQGSGKWYTVIDGHCSCPDATFRAVTCKHTRATLKEEQALAQYCADWDARALPAELDDLPGDFLDSIDSLAFDEDGGLLPPARGAWYKGTYYTAEQCDQAEQARAASPVCPDCGAPLQAQSYHVGGKGMTCFLVCTRDVEHRALPA